MFIHGEAHDEVVVLNSVILWMGYTTLIQGKTLKLSEFSLYPTTGSYARMAVGEGVALFHWLLEQARQQGFTEFVLIGVRRGGQRSGRIVHVRRTL